MNSAISERSLSASGATTSLSAISRLQRRKDFLAVAPAPFVKLLQSSIQIIPQGEIFVDIVQQLLTELISQLVRKLVGFLDRAFEFRHIVSTRQNSALADD